MKNKMYPQLFRYSRQQIFHICTSGFITYLMLMQFIHTVFSLLFTLEQSLYFLHSLPDSKPDLTAHVISVIHIHAFFLLIAIQKERENMTTRGKHA